MKYVVHAKQVAHLWANNHSSAHQQYARNGRNFSFSGGTLTSYTTRIGELVTIKPATGTGKRYRESVRVALLTSRKYSVTTNKQQNWAYHALPQDVAVYEVPNLHGMGESSAVRDNLAWFAKRIGETVEKARNAKGRKLSHLASLVGLIATANAYAKTFKAEKFKAFKLAKIMPDYEAERAKGTAIEACRIELEAAREIRDAARFAERDRLRALDDVEFKAEHAAQLDA